MIPETPLNRFEKDAPRLSCALSVDGAIVQNCHR
jgi:hypothetical protein